MKCRGLVSLFGATFFVLWMRRWSPAFWSVSAAPPERHNCGEELPTGYDVRLGSANYSQIVGTIGGFAVAAITLIFTENSNLGEEAISQATSLLVLALTGCLLGAFDLAAIAGEQRLTPNLPPAALWAAVPSVIGITAVLAAFATLSVAYLSDSSLLFVLTTYGASVMGILMTSFAIADSTGVPAPADPTWVARQWLKDQNAAYRATMVTAVLGSLPITAALVVFLVQGPLDLLATYSSLAAGLGIAACLIASAVSLFRTSHAPDVESMGPTRREAVIAVGLLSVTLSGVLLSLPKES